MKNFITNILKAMSFKLGIALALLLVFGFSDTYASHFRYGNISWTTVSTKRAEFTVTTAWRSTFVGSTRLFFGDGGSVTFSLSGATIATGPGFKVQQFVVQHTYATNGPFLSFFSSCCRIGGIVNASGGFKVSSTVNFNNGNLSSPITSVPIILQMVQGGLNQVQLVAIDLQGDILSWSLSTIAGHGGTYSIPTAGIYTMTISSGGLLSWNTTSTVVGQFWTVRLVVREDRGSAKTEVDFFVQIVGGSINQPPTCSYLGAGNNVLTVGQNFQFQITGLDPDGDNLVVTNQGLPPGATLSPTSGAQPLTTTFSWTPQPSDAGTAHVIVVIFTDPSGFNTSCSFAVAVPSNSPPNAVCQNITVSADGNCQGNASASDFDGGSTDPDGDPITFSVSPSGPYSLGTTTVTLTVCDSSNACSTCTAVITVVDNTNPTISCPADVSGLNCLSDVPAVGTPTASDNCSVSVTFNGETSNGGSGCNGDPLVLTRSWTATDSAGNTASCSQTITVESSSLSIDSITPQNHVIDCIPIPVTITAYVSGGCPGYSYLWSNGESGASITVNPDVTTPYDVKVTDANGCVVETTGGSGITITVINRCGKNDRKSLICHVPPGNPGNEHTICVDRHALKAHLEDTFPPMAHGGDYCGPCNNGNKTGYTVDNAPDYFLTSYPNPNYGISNIEFGLGYDSYVTVSVFNMSGELIAILFEGNMSSGNFQVATFDATDLPAGMYIYKMTTSDNIYHQRLILDK